ncbi:MAG: hypothetical protein AAF557_22835 [Pseudomonadota bacterium]
MSDEQKIGRRFLRAALIGGVAFCVGSSFAQQALAEPNADWRLCHNAVGTVGSISPVPKAFLQGIMLVESGRTVDRRRVPWPWTINHKGKGYWHPTRAAAEAHIERLLAAGYKSFDVGCAQVNYRYHGKHFPTAKSMLDPTRNLAYAGRFLASLKSQAGCWGQAVSWYHSRTPKHAKRYLAAVRRTFARQLTYNRPELKTQYLAMLECGSQTPQKVAKKTVSRRAVTPVRANARRDAAAKPTTRAMFKLLLKKNTR